MANYAIMRLSKVKTMGHVAGLGKHIERERETPNAAAERTFLNERLAGTGDWYADVEARLQVAPRIRKNAVLSIEMMLGASPEWWTAGTEAEQDRRRDAWRDLSMAWLRETFGEANVVAAVLHRDELTTHVQALVVPIDERGRLSCRAFIGGDRHRLAELQTSYAEKVRPLGLERGIEGSVATHQEVKRWYAMTQEVSRDVTQQLAATVEIELPGTVVSRPREYARQQHDRVVASVAPQMEALAHKAQQLSLRVERQELQIAAQAEREQASKAMLAHLRKVNMGTVMTALGGHLDREDWRKWHLGDEVIAMNGEKFQSLTRHRGGNGAIDLVKHVRPDYEFEDAVVFLSRRLGADVAVVAAARYAQNIAGREPVPPLRVPEERSEMTNHEETHDQDKVVVVWISPDDVRYPEPMAEAWLTYSPEGTFTFHSPTHSEPVESLDASFTAAIRWSMQTGIPVHGPLFDGPDGYPPMMKAAVDRAIEREANHLRPRNGNRESDRAFER